MKIPETDYEKYLDMKDFQVTKSFLETYGEKLDYEPEFIKIKLKEDMIRKQFYKKDLHKQPYYQLVKCNDKFSKCKLYDYLLKDEKNLVIAGGSITNEDKKTSDVDIFFCGKTTEESELIHDNFVKKFTCGKIISTPRVTIIYVLFEKKRYEIQLIRRVYRTPAEILYGFDVDCCGFLYDGKNYWGSERAIYSYKNKVINFDEGRFSETYLIRLAKYAVMKNYKIHIPNFDEKKVDKDKIKRLFSDLIPNLRYSDCGFAIDMYKFLSQRINMGEFRERLKDNRIIFYLAYFFCIFPKNEIKKMSSDSDYTILQNGPFKSIGEFKVGKDIIIISKSRPGTSLTELFSKEKLLRTTYSGFGWIDKNPMSQVCGSFKKSIMKSMYI